MGDQPEDESRCFVTGQIVQNQQHAQGRQGFGQGEAPGEPCLPALPLTANEKRGRLNRWVGQLGHNFCQMLLEPGVQNIVRASSHPAEANVTGCRMKQC